MAQLDRVCGARVGSVLAAVDCVPLLNQTLVLEAVPPPCQNDHLPVARLLLPLEPLGPETTLHVAVAPLQKVLPSRHAVRTTGPDLTATPFQLQPLEGSEALRNQTKQENLPKKNI